LRQEPLKKRALFFFKYQHLHSAIVISTTQHPAQCPLPSSGTQMESI